MERSSPDIAVVLNQTTIPPLEKEKLDRLVSHWSGGSPTSVAEIDLSENLLSAFNVKPLNHYISNAGSQVQVPVTGETTISPKGGEGDCKEEPKPEPKPEPEPIITEVPLPKAHEDLISNLNKWSVKDGTCSNPFNKFKKSRYRVLTKYISE